MKVLLSLSHLISRWACAGMEVVAVWQMDIVTHAIVIKSSETANIKVKAPCAANTGNPHQHPETELLTSI